MGQLRGFFKMQGVYFLFIFRHSRVNMSSFLLGARDKGGKHSFANYLPIRESNVEHRGIDQEKQCGDD